MKIISRYLTKEILNTLLGLTFVLLLIFLINQLIRYLSYAAAGKVASNIIFEVMGFAIPSLLALLLPLGLYLGIILAYGRLYADSELRVLHACGLGIGRLIAITSGIVFITAGIVLLLTIWVNPWLSEHKDKLIAESLTADNILNTLMPGRFQVSSDGKRVLYVERISHGHKVASNLFLADQGTKNNLSSLTVVSASTGSQATDPANQDRFIVASDGYRYEGIPGQNDFKIIQFKKYAVRMPQAIALSKRQEQESMSTQFLLNHYQDTANVAEFQWRLSIPLSVLLLGLLAVPLSHVAPRHGRYSQLFPALLIYIVYINMLFVGRNWVEERFVPTFIGMWWIHLIVFALAMVFVMIQSGWSVKRLLGRS
jgi:lipopolysaccharide export system permease protein